LKKGRWEEERRGAEGKHPENCGISKDKGRKRDMFRKCNVRWASITAGESKQDREPDA